MSLCFGAAVSVLMGQQAMAATVADGISSPGELMGTAALGLVVMDVFIALLVVLIDGSVGRLPRRMLSVAARFWPASRSRAAAVRSIGVAAFVTAVPAVVATVAHVRF